MASVKREQNNIPGAVLQNTLGTNTVFPTGVALTDSTPAHVAIVDGNGDQVTSFGGGTQYTDGGVPPAHPVGATIEWSDGSNWQTVSTAKPLPVTASIDTTGLATSAKQPALGTAGLSSTDVISVQGIASGTALPISVASIPSHAVTNAGTFAVQAAEADGANVTLGAKADAKNAATDTTAISAMSVLKQISASVQAPPSQAVTNTGTFAVQATLQAASGVDIGKLTANQSVNVAQINGVAPLMGNGTTGTGSQRVTIASDNTAFAVNATLSAETTKVIGTVNIASAQTLGTVTTVTSVTQNADVRQATASNLNAQVVGSVASAATDSGNPVKVGGVGKTANPTAVTDGQRVNAIFDKLGKQVVVGSIRDLKGVQKTTITSSTSETTIVTAVASTFLDVYGLIITNTSGTASNVTIKDATAGTTRIIFTVPAGDTRGFMIPESGAIPQAAVNNNWTATCGTSVASIEITALYVKNL